MNGPLLRADPRHRIHRKRTLRTLRCGSLFRSIPPWLRLPNRTETELPRRFPSWTRRGVARNVPPSTRPDARASLCYPATASSSRLLVAGGGYPICRFHCRIADRQRAPSTTDLEQADRNFERPDPVWSFNPPWPDGARECSVRTQRRVPAFRQPS